MSNKTTADLIALKPCPLCENEKPEFATGMGETWVLCQNCGCSSEMAANEAAARKRWNTRPIEQKQADHLAELKAALTWRTDFENAPRDRSYIVAILKPDNKFLKSKMVAVRYFEEEEGWSMPGFGGMPDSWFQCFFIPPQAQQHKEPNDE